MFSLTLEDTRGKTNHAVRAGGSVLTALSRQCPYHDNHPRDVFSSGICLFVCPVDSSSCDSNMQREKFAILTIFFKCTTQE